MKRLLTLILSLILAMPLISCDNTGNKPTETTQPQTVSSEAQNNSQTQSANATQSASATQATNTQSANVTQTNSTKPTTTTTATTTTTTTTTTMTTTMTTTEEVVFPTREAYVVGEDLEPGQYLVQCTSTENVMNVIVFQSKTDYENFLNADIETLPGYDEAVETHSWSRSILPELDFAYVSLAQGNVLFIDNGRWKMEEHTLVNSGTLYSGVYVVGEDIPAGEINYKCISGYVQITKFENLVDYSNYYRTPKLTLGQISSALEKYAITHTDLETNRSGATIIENGQVLLIESGSAEFFFD